jgi:hypothetical protein
MKVTVQNDLVVLCRFPQPLAKGGILRDRRHMVMIRNYEKRNSLYSRLRKILKDVRHDFPCEGAHIVNRDDKGPAPRLHLQKACVNGMLLIDV